MRLTWYVIDKREYVASLSALAAPYREVMGRHYPAMTAVEVTALIEDRATRRDRGDGGRARPGRRVKRPPRAARAGAIIEGRGPAGRAALRSCP